MTGIIDKLSWLTHKGSFPGPGLGGGLVGTGVNSRGINQGKKI